MTDLGGSAGVAAVAAAIGVAAIKLLEHIIQRRWRARDAATHLYGEARLGEIAGAKELRDEMMEQIQRLWQRVREQDETIDQLREELSGCEGRHRVLAYEHERMLREVKRQLPDFDLDGG